MPANGTPNGEGTVDHHRGERRSEQRVHMSEAAALLGECKDAVRLQVKRGTLPSERSADGRVYVWVNVNPYADPDGVCPEAQAETWWTLIDELRDRVHSLEESIRENWRIIAALTSRIPQLPAADASRATEPREAPTGPTEQPGRWNRSRPARVHERAHRGPGVVGCSGDELSDETVGCQDHEKVEKHRERLRRRAPMTGPPQEELREAPSSGAEPSEGEDLWLRGKDAQPLVEKRSSWWWRMFRE